MSLPESAYYVGVDWGSAEHAVCVLAEWRVHARFAIPHTADQYTDLAHRLARLGDAELVPVAIEAPTAAWSTHCWRPGTPSCR